MRQIGFVVFPNYSVMSFAAVPVFELANAFSRSPVYALQFLSEKGGLVATSAGMGVETERFDRRRLDTLIVGGGTVIEPGTPNLVAFLRRSLSRCRRVTSICGGAYHLAEAGLLDGRRATTHWAYVKDMQERFPKVTIDMDRIFIQDGPVWTSAGMTAGIDLALALVEADFGLELTRAISKKLVMYHRRAGGQSQFSALLELEPKSDRIQNVLRYAKQHLRNPLSVEELAEVAHLSARQFSRLFHAETGQSPARAVEALRVEEARIMVEDGEHSIDEVASHTGFGDRDRMRRAFLRAFGQPPQALKRTARAPEESPA
ncbi:MAG TPA: GlxA family transcriptional regulator [Candidatus Methylacidiphilales bacterium]